MNKTILLVALEMPPCRSAGVQRPFRFAEYLLELGWNPIVLTAEPDIYQRLDHDLTVSAELQSRIFRCKATDATKLFSVAGKYPNFINVPDRYWPWYFSAVKLGNQLVEKFKPAYIWSTYPVMTAHLIARTLAKKHQLSWVADFRDPIQCHYNPSYQHFNGLTRALERKVIQNADRVCTTTEEAAALYRQIYRGEQKDKFFVIENGFVPLPAHSPITSKEGRFVLLYSGALYGNGRDISSIFNVISELKQQQYINRNNFVLRFRGSSKPGQFDRQLADANIADVVEFLPAIPFEQAINEMHHSSANMLIQDEIFKYQIPGKLYDYIQTQKPLLAICPPDSATANRCKSLPNCLRAWTATELSTAVLSLIKGTAATLQLTEPELQKYSRRNGTMGLVRTLCELDQNK